MEKRTPIQKSIVRHKLKEIDKKWAGRKVPAPEKALKHIQGSGVRSEIRHLGGHKPTKKEVEEHEHNYPHYEE